MSKVVLQITDATVKFNLGPVDTPPIAGDWTTPDVDASCQVTTAAVVANPVTQTAPATFCEGETDIVGKSKWQVDLAGLQDITESTGISMWLFEHETEAAWVQIIGPTNETGDKIITIVAPVRIQAGNLLGPAGTPLDFSVSLPAQAKPTVTHSVVA